MYPHVAQFETRRQQFARELQLIRQREQAQACSQPSATRAERDVRGRVADRTPEHLELEPELTIERTPA